jgi:type IV pilus assembly protein PilM
MIMARKVTTLFIRDDAINLLIMDGKRVDKWASLPLEPGLVSQGRIIDEAQVAEKLKELFKLQKATMGKVIAGLSGHNSVYRIIAMPELPEAVLPEAVKREAGRVIPVPLDEVYLAYQPLPTLMGETRIFLTAYPRNIADALYRTLQQAGLQPYIMDLAPLALCRTVNAPRSIIVNARLDHLDIVVMADRIPQLIRRLALPAEEASLSERVPTIAEEIDRTIAFYNSSHQEQPLNSTVPMFVCGDLVEVPDSWPSLAGKSGCPVSILPSPVESPPGFKANDFIINIGLAFKELMPEKEGDNFSLVNINALPEIYLPKPVHLPNIIVPICATIGVGILIYMGFLVFNRASHTDALRSDLDTVNTNIAQEHTDIESLKEQVDLLEPQFTTLEAITDIFDNTFTSLGAVRADINGDLQQIASVLPKDVNLTDLNHTGDALRVWGIASDEDDIFEYARDLRASGRFSVVIISSIEAVEVDEMFEEFEFEFLLK